MTRVRIAIIKDMRPIDVRTAAKDAKFFAKVLDANPGFVESCVLGVIGGKRDHADYDDLISIGKAALWKATKKFDEKRLGSSSFSTFAWRVIQNSARQELKILNRMRREDVSLERFAFTQSAQMGGGNSGGYNELAFSDANGPEIRRLRNFENCILDEMVLRESLTKLSDYERKIFGIRFLDGKTLKETAVELGINFHTLREWYYKEAKPKFDQLATDAKEAMGYEDNTYTKNNVDKKQKTKRAAKAKSKSKGVSTDVKRSNGRKKSSNSK